MAKPSKPRTQEAAALTNAFKAADAPTMASVADKIGVSAGLVSQWATGHRPVPWDKAASLAEHLDIAPEQISAAYRSAAAHFKGLHTSSEGAWQAYEAAAHETRAAIDLLLLPPRQRAAALASSPLSLAGVDLLERHATEALTNRKTA